MCKDEFSESANFFRTCLDPQTVCWAERKGGVPASKGVTIGPVAHVFEEGVEVVQPLRGDGDAADVGWMVRVAALGFHVPPCAVGGVARSVDHVVWLPDYFAMQAAAGL